MTLGATGCGPAQLVNALLPSDGYRIERDVAYGALDRQRLDVYQPDDLSDPADVVVFFYGGGWDSGSKATYPFVGQALASRGFVVVVPDYRVFPEVGFPAFVEDGAAAVAWVRANAARFGGDPERVHLMGHSAGAHIAAMLALNHGYLEEAGVELGIVRTLVGLAGPYDFLPLSSRRLEEIFAGADLAATQPINFVDGSAPPTLLLHGTNDTTVRPRNSEHLATALDAAGVPVTLERYDNVGHVVLVAAIATPLRWLAPTLDDVTAFLGSWAKERGPAGAGPRAHPGRYGSW